MKRRSFNVLAGTSMVALVAGTRAFGQSASSDFAALSKTTLTPVGAERAGNAAGTIPAWTGGMTSIPEGVNWNPATSLPPDFFAGEAPLYTVNAGNLSQYADLLCDGVQALIQKQGFSLSVFPSHRTAACPQWVYDNIAQNADRAKLSPDGGRLGFTGAFGGIPFPVPDANDPLAGGAMVTWNHITRWSGTYISFAGSSWIVASGQPQKASGFTISYYYPYYDNKLNVDSYSEMLFYQNISSTYPPNEAGEFLVFHQPTNPATTPISVWQLLLGQGRVRKAPELQYDTPSSYTNGLTDFDEYNGFDGALDEYDWKLLGKKEMLVPYNNNKLANSPSAETIGPKFLNPDVVRWELHRVWVVDATLHPGKRNVFPHRRLYVDEDTWQVVMTDSWDANGIIYKHAQVFTVLCPQLPGLVDLNTVDYNLQTGDYATLNGPSGEPPYNAPYNFSPIPMSQFQPQTMAANATY